MAVSPKLLQILKDMGSADLQVLVTELVPALEDEIAVLFPSVAVELSALEAGFNPTLQSALSSLAAKVQF